MGVAYQPVGASVWHNEGCFSASSDPVMMDRRNACKVLKCFLRIDCGDIVLVGRTLFDVGESLFIL